MSETVLIALLTGVFTLCSGVIGIVLTHRYTRGRDEAVRRDERRRDARALTAQFVNAGTQWARSQEVLVPAYFKAGNDQNFWVEWPDTDSGKALRENAQIVERAAGELRLIVSDAVLLDAIAKALELQGDSSAMGELLEESKRTSGTSWREGTMSKAFAHYRAVALAFGAVEARAAELLRGDL